VLYQCNWLVLSTTKQMPLYIVFLINSVSCKSAPAVNEHKNQWIILNYYAFGNCVLHTGIHVFTHIIPQSRVFKLLRTRHSLSCFGCRWSRQSTLPTSGFTGRLKTGYSVRLDSHKYKTVEVISRTSDSHLTYKIPAGISSTPDISLSASNITK
jgi:hypothetical protein